MTNSKHSGSQKYRVQKPGNQQKFQPQHKPAKKGDLSMKKSGVQQSVLVTGVAVLVTFALGCFLPAFADTVKFGHVAPPFHGQAKGVDAFADYVKEKTNGEIEIATFPAGQLGGERSMAEQVQA
ncbi:MAG: hypothetical protein LC658_06800, partial [Bacteroidales bacterium]|nr:hypothetical protein [Bacteroidales bacterium]